MNCPRCDVELAPVHPDAQRSEIAALKCPGCGGHWLEEADLHRVEEVVEVTWWEFRHIPPEDLQNELLACPRCTPRRHLVKVRSERDRKVVMDSCTECHGVWLDGGELEAIEQKGVLAALLDAVKYVAKR